MIPGFLTLWAAKWFAWRNLDKLWQAFCAFVSTPLGAAIVALAVGLIVGDIHGHRKVAAQWAAADAIAERQRDERDAEIDRRAIARTVPQLRDLALRAATYEHQRDQYEKMLSLRTGVCALSDADARELSVIGTRKPASHGFSPQGLRSLRRPRAVPGP
jgi:hypothetical protein